jgi:hypothetical protein
VRILERGLLLEAVHLTVALEGLLTEADMGQLDWRLVEPLIAEGVVDEVLVSILGGVDILVDEVGEVGTLRELPHESLQGPGMGVDEPLDLVVLLEVELLPRLLREADLPWTAPFAFGVEEVVVLQEEEHGLEEDVLDMLSAEDVLVLLLVHLEEEELLLQQQHLEDSVPGVDFVRTQLLQRLL